MTTRQMVHRSIRTTLLITLAAVALAVSAQADPLSLSASPNPALIGDTVTFTFSPKILSEADVVDFDFGDGQQSTVTYSTYCGLFGGCGTTTHIFGKAGKFTVSAQGTIGGAAVSGSVEVAISVGKEVYVLAAAHAGGNNNTVWRTDLEVFNPGTSTATYEIALLPRGSDNSVPATRTFSLAPGASTRENDVLSRDFGFTGTAALRITPKAGSILVTSRTYNAGTEGTYGQYVPALPITQAISGDTRAYLLQLSHDPTLKQGFRTNVGLVNPTPVSEDVRIAFYSSDGTRLGSTIFTLKPYGYEQLDRAFELATKDPVPDGFVTVSNLIDGLFFTYASVVDNLTGDPTLIPALAP